MNQNLCFGIMIYSIAALVPFTALTKPRTFRTWKILALAKTAVGTEVSFIFLNAHTNKISAIGKLPAPWQGKCCLGTGEL